MRDRSQFPVHSSRFTAPASQFMVQGSRLSIGNLIRLGCVLVSAAMLVACNSNPTDNKSDSVSNQDTGKPVQAMTISEPVSPVPKQTADSIWNGDYVEKYPNGVISKRGYISGGLASGEWLTFHDDGKPWSRGFYRNGIRTGYGVSWWKNGQKSSEGYYNNGKMVGVWSYWSEANHTLMVKDYGGTMPDTTQH